MKIIWISLIAAIAIAVLAAIILGGVDMSSMTVFQSPGNVRL
jgi:hypothetical protein